MSNRQKSFAFSSKRRDQIRFDVNGGEEFRGVEDIDGLTLLWYVSTMQDPEKATAGLIEFLKIAIEPEDYPAFQERCKQERLDIPDITEVAAWLLEQYTERPTKSPSSTSSGESNTGSGSTETSGFTKSTLTESPAGV